MNCGCVIHGNPFDMNEQIVEACVLHLAWAGTKLREKELQIRDYEHALKAIAESFGPAERTAREVLEMYKEAK